MKIPHYETFKRNGKIWGRLLSDHKYKTPITGFDVVIESRQGARLKPSGILHIYAMSEWDFGSGAIDTPAMVYASLAHDVFCEMTDKGILPWECRFEADKYFWTCLSEGGAIVSRFWRVPAVMLYSQLFARWRREK